MIEKTIIAIFLTAAIFLSLTSVCLAEVTPEVQLGGRGIISMSWQDTSDDSSLELADISDSSLLIGLRQKLYSDYRGQFVVGFQFPDEGSGLGEVFFPHVFIRLEDETNMFTLGRSRATTSLIEFPTLRDDDAIAFTDFLNPFSSGDADEDTRYSTMFEYRHAFDQRYWITLHADHFSESSALFPSAGGDIDVNSYGAIIQYMVPESQRFNRETLAQAGIGFIAFDDVLASPEGPGSDTLTGLQCSFVLNIDPDPVHFWDLRHQIIYTSGIAGIDTISGYESMARASALSNLVSIRYLFRELEDSASQISLSYGYKSFRDLEDSASQSMLLLNYIERLGENFDLGFQYRYDHFTGDLKDLYGSSEHLFQVALIYSVDVVWNEQFDDRDSLLNLEHGYIP